MGTHALRRTSLFRNVLMHVARRHCLYRRLVVLVAGTIAVLLVAHWLEVMFATVSVMHFLTLDDILARYGL